MDIFTKLKVPKQNGIFKPIDKNLKRIKVMDKDEVFNSLNSKDFDNNNKFLDKKLDYYVDNIKFADIKKRTCLKKSNIKSQPNIKEKMNIKIPTAKSTINTDSAKTIQLKTCHSMSRNITKSLTEETRSERLYNKRKKNLINCNESVEFKLQNAKLEYLNTFFKNDDKVKKLINEFHKISEPNLDEPKSIYLFSREKILSEDKPKRKNQDVKLLKYEAIKPKFKKIQINNFKHIYKNPQGIKAYNIMKSCHNDILLSNRNTRRLEEKSDKIELDSRETIRQALRGGEPDLVKRIVYEESINYLKTNGMFIYNTEGYNFDNYDRLYSCQFEINLNDYK